ncbi:hypothetical protein BH10BAC5_BH10BAC5_05040 [soil metagenome]
MKKITTLFLSMLLLAVLVNISEAQPIKPKPKYGYATISVTGGIANPIGSFTDNSKLGLAFGGGFGYRMTREVGLELSAIYNSFGNQSANTSKLNVIAITAGPRYYFVNSSIKSQLFVDADLGAFIASSADNTVGGVTTAGISETNFGIGIGLGGTVQVADNMELFLRTRYNTILPGKDVTVGTTTVSADSKSYISALGGLTFFLR